MTFDDAVALFQKRKKADRTLDVKVLRPKN
nr:MAG TPA: hypothetical protein [Caudoviricetes sp.]